MSGQLMTIQDVEKIAEAVAKSNLFGAKTKEQAFSLMMISQAEGKHPAMACQEYDIIQGRPALKSSAMLGRFQQSGGKVSWITHTDEEVSAEFYHPNSPNSLLISWTMERAKKAGLCLKENWAKYPRQMLRARVISEGVRATYPASCSGLYTPEEVYDFDDKKIENKTQINTVCGLKEKICVDSPINSPINSHLTEDANIIKEEKNIEEQDSPVNSPINSPTKEEIISSEVSGLFLSAKEISGTSKTGKKYNKTNYQVKTEEFGNIFISIWGSKLENLTVGESLTFNGFKKGEYNGKPQYSAESVYSNKISEKNPEEQWAEEENKQN